MKTQQDVDSIDLESKDLQYEVTKTTAPSTMSIATKHDNLCS